MKKKIKGELIIDNTKVIRFSDLAIEEKLKLTDEKTLSIFDLFIYELFVLSINAMFFVSIYLNEITITLHLPELLLKLRSKKSE